jgi:hydroxymethylpyrimidine pyrophosphatase-like HAD family hydrolase
MACGDNTNDREMVEWAGLGVSVANGVEELKRAADYISAAERSWGVKEAVDRFVLRTGG